MTPIYGLILAGGLGSRLGGVRKGELRVGGQTIVARTRASFGDAMREVLISTGRHGVVYGEGIALPDGAEAEGPMGGLRAAVAHLDRIAEAIIISAPADSPFLPSDYVERLVDSVREHAAGFAVWGENFYPTHAAWRLSALRGVTGENSPKAAQRSLGATPVRWDDLEQNPFLNINSVGDLLACQRMEAQRQTTQVIHNAV